MKADYLNITEAARKLDIPRSTLSKLLDEYKVQKLKQGKDTLVSYIDADMAVRQALKDGRIKSRTPTGRSQTATEDASGAKKPDEMTMFLMEQVRNLQRERDDLKDKVRALESIEGDKRLLIAAAVEKDRKISELESELKALKAQDRKGASAKLDSKLLKKANKIIDIVRGKD